jgi:hypothetical protein
MNRLNRTDLQFNENGYWSNPCILQNISDIDLNLFDQIGFDLSGLEKLYAEENLTQVERHRYKSALRKNWLTYDKPVDIISGAHLNHAFLFERKGYAGEALKQLQSWSLTNPVVFKLIKYMPKWGVDFNMDYVDFEGNVFEILHFEYDSFSYDEITEVENYVLHKLLPVDWDDVAKSLLKRKDEWHCLSFFEQSNWKCKYFGLMPEKFKQLAWI